MQTTPGEPDHRDSPPPGTMAEVFGAFLRLGLTSFGGPLAHIGYFRHEFVERRGWLDESRFAGLLAICQVLPGPASSQMGFALGLARAGWGGALAAFVAFTLPSVLLLLAFAAGAPVLPSVAHATLVHGLKLAAVAVVAQGLAGMAQRLAADAPRALIAAAACALIVLTGKAWAQLFAIGLGALAGRLFCASDRPLSVAPPTRHGPRTAAVCGALFAMGLGAALALPAGAPMTVLLVAKFYQAGALVFGGGHVVLPLLAESVVAPGWIPADVFLSGYGAAQAVPGPMFSLAAFLGAQVPTGAPALIGATLATLAIFLPGFLLLAAVLPAWQRLTAMSGALRLVAGIDAAVVGLLAAALYDPVWLEGVHSPADFAIAAVAFALLAGARLSALWGVIWCVGATLLVHLTGKL